MHPSDIMEMQINLAPNGRYSTLLDNLVIMLHSISQQWEIYIDQIQSQHYRNSYQVPIAVVNRPGLACRQA